MVDVLMIVPEHDTRVDRFLYWLWSFLRVDGFKDRIRDRRWNRGIKQRSETSPDLTDIMTVEPVLEPAPRLIELAPGTCRNCHVPTPAPICIHCTVAGHV